MLSRFGLHMRAGRGLKFHSTHIWPWTSHWTSHLSREEAMFFQTAFAKLWNFPLNDFYKCTGLCKIPLPCYAASKGDSSGDCPLWVYGFSRLGRWKWFQSLGIPYRLCHLNVTKCTLWLSYNPVYGPQAFSPSRSLPLWFPKCCCLSNATTSGCGKLLSHRHPLETAPRRRKAPFWQVRKQLQSSLQDTQRWGREENKMWMGGVKGIWGLALHWPQLAVSFWFFSWGREEVRNKKATK